MFVDAIFVLEEIAIETMTNLRHSQKLDYFLGKNGSIYFEKYLIDMVDFFLYPKNVQYLFQTILMNFEELNIEHLNIIYRDENISLLEISKKKSLSLKKKITKKNWNIIIEELKDISNIEISNSNKEILLLKLQDIMLILDIAIQSGVRTIVSFRNN